MPYRPRPGTAPIPNKPGATNWVEKAGGLPSYIRRIAEHLRGQGKSTSVAIATAVNTVKRWAAGGTVTAHGGSRVTAKTQAQASAALADWNRKKAQSHSNPAAPASRLVLLAERLSDDLSKCVILSSSDFRTIFSEADVSGKLDLTATSALTTEVRKKALKKGRAMKPLSGSKTPRFPINDAEDVTKAVHALGRAKGDKSKVIAHIKRAAKKVSGGWERIPDSWKSSSLSVPAQYVTVADDGAYVDLAGQTYGPFGIVDAEANAYTLDLAWSDASRKAAAAARRSKGRGAGAPSARPRLVTRTARARRTTAPLVGKAARRRITKAFRAGQGPSVRQVRKRLVRKYDVNQSGRLGAREIRRIRTDRKINRLTRKLARKTAKIKRLNTPPSSYGRGGGMSKGATRGLAGSSRSSGSTRVALHRYRRIGAY